MTIRTQLRIDFRPFACLVSCLARADRRPRRTRQLAKKVFKKCMTCHRIGHGAKNAVGPEQNGLIGRQAGTVPGFAYSPLNKSAGENGLIWTEEMIFAYLPDPNAFLNKFLNDKGKADLAKGVDQDGVQACRAKRSART